jgi:hypothetical protein
MKSENFESVKMAKKAAKAQLEFYNSMMSTKEATEQLAEYTEMAKRKFTDEQIIDAVKAMSTDKETSVTKKKLYVVDTIVTFRHKYVIEADALEHAYDEVTMRESGNALDDFSEVTQRFLGETIADGREITKKEFKQMLVDLSTDKDELSSYWLGKDLIRKIDYDRE